MKQNKFMVLFCTIFATIGLWAVIGGVITTLISAKFMKNAEPVTAVITDIQHYREHDGKEGHDVYVTYQYDGVEYEDISLGFYSSSMRKGQSLEVLCDSNNPEKIRSQSGLTFVQIVLYSLGGVFILIGLIPGLVTIGKNKKKNALLQNGIALTATVEQIGLNQTVSANGAHPYVIYCEYRDPIQNVIYRFKSDNVWDDPNPYYPVGSEITVMADPNDYSKHYVKTDLIGKDIKIVDYT